MDMIFGGFLRLLTMPLRHSSPLPRYSLPNGVFSASRSAGVSLNANLAHLQSEFPGPLDAHDLRYLRLEGVYNDDVAAPVVAQRARLAHGAHFAFDEAVALPACLQVASLFPGA